MARAQCLVVRERKILMVKHRLNGQEYWCLPGGRIEPDESPAEASLRELREECNVNGRIILETSIVNYPEKHYTFLIDIGYQEPYMGSDPELDDEDQIMQEIRWLSLDEITERDRAYLWSAGLLCVNGFLAKIESWGDEISYPKEIL